MRLFRTLLILYLHTFAIVASPTTVEQGGKIVVALRSEPRTFNPLTSMDNASREVISRLNADLITQNRATQATEPALAESWAISPDGKRYTLHLRKGLLFSDGQPFDADDVVFSVKAYLDERTHSPQRDLLLINGSPVQVYKVDQLTVSFDLPTRYATAERMFDGLAMLPRHLLQQSFQNGTLSHSWTLDTLPSQLAGLGPFRLRTYSPGQRLILERNPYYWKKGQPYLDEIVFLFAGDEDAQMARFLAGETDLISRLSPKNAAVIRSRGFDVADAGPSLEYNFLFFNLTANAPLPARQWFAQKTFRQAVSMAVDRQSMVSLVYADMATPLLVHVTPGNKMWAETQRPTSSNVNLGKARQLLRAGRFIWDRNGMLTDENGKQVDFTILAPASNAERSQMATLIADDLKAIGITAHVVTLEFRSLVERILKTQDYDAAVMGLGAGDGDPNSEINVWLSSGGMHIWNPAQAKPQTAWEAEIDDLMKKQEVEADLNARRRLYWRVQDIEAEQLPIISLVSPHVLAACRRRLHNFHPVILGSDMLWNSDQFWVEHKPPPGAQSAW